MTIIRIHSNLCIRPSRRTVSVAFSPKNFCAFPLERKEPKGQIAGMTAAGYHRSSSRPHCSDCWALHFPPPLAVQAATSQEYMTLSCLRKRMVPSFPIGSPSKASKTSLAYNPPRFQLNSNIIPTWSNWMSEFNALHVPSAPLLLQKLASPDWWGPLSAWLKDYMYGSQTVWFHKKLQTQELKIQIHQILWFYDSHDSGFLECETSRKFMKGSWWVSFFIFFLQQGPRFPKLPVSSCRVACHSCRRIHAAGNSCSIDTARLARLCAGGIQEGHVFWNHLTSSLHLFIYSASMSITCFAHEPLHCLRLNPQGGEARVLPMRQQVFPRQHVVQSHGAPHTVLILHRCQGSENGSPPGLGWHNRCSLPHRRSCSERQCQHIHHFLRSDQLPVLHSESIGNHGNQCKCAQRKCWCPNCKRNWVKPKRIGENDAVHCEFSDEMRLKAGPPLLPLLMAASIWMPSSSADAWV